MPFPLGHSAIGLATYHTIDTSPRGSSRWKVLAFIVVLANLPDVDTIAGLVLAGNGDLYHRGPTHSLVFAFLAGYLASHAWRLGRFIPRLRFSLCFLIVFSHVIADMTLTESPVSLLWPFEVHWSAGNSGWGRVIQSAIFSSLQDVGILLMSVAYIFVLKMVRRWLPEFRVPALARRRIR
jgi:membrane-bound metal-dependent hydrolase YbcI (DUF457 family)